MTTTISPRGTSSSARYARLPSMNEGTWLDITVVGRAELFKNMLFGNYYVVQLHTGLNSADVGEHETYDLLVVVNEKRDWAREPNGYRVSQILLPTIDLLSETTRLSGLNADRLGEWLLGEVKGRRSIRRRQQEGWLVKQVREAIATEIEYFEHRR